MDDMPVEAHLELHQVDGVIGDVAGDVAKFGAPRIIMKK